MAWCCQASSHYLNQWWSTLMMPCSISIPQRFSQISKFPSPSLACPHMPCIIPSLPQPISRWESPIMSSIHYATGQQWWMKSNVVDMLLELLLLIDQHWFRLWLDAIKIYTFSFNKNAYENIIYKIVFCSGQFYTHHEYWFMSNLRVSDFKQGSFSVCVQPMRGDVTL